jgi:hypothetical protein
MNCENCLKLFKGLKNGVLNSEFSGFQGGRKVFCKAGIWAENGVGN